MRHLITPQSQSQQLNQRTSSRNQCTQVGQRRLGFHVQGSNPEIYISMNIEVVKLESNVLGLYEL